MSPSLYPCVCRLPAAHVALCAKLNYVPESERTCNFLVNETVAISAMHTIVQFTYAVLPLWLLHKTEGVKTTKLL